jgi:transcriptional regulator with XRE-family HTH domain
LDAFLREKRGYVPIVRQAKLCGISPPQYRQLETGERGAFLTRDRVAKLAKGFGVSELTICRLWLNGGKRTG